MRRYTVSQREALRVSRRVLTLVNKYLYRQRQDLLVTDGRGLMTWGEIRHHVRAALSLRVRP